MAFDGIDVLPRSEKTSLQFIARALGLNPISEPVLSQHKTEQIRLHPPSRFYRRHQLLVGCAFWVFFLGICCIISGIVAAMPLLLIPGFAALVLSVWLVTFASFKGLARWREEEADIDGDATIPPEIAEAARVLSSAVPVSLYKGTLYQNKIRLDPYLVAYPSDGMVRLSPQDRGERVILGIWDGKKVIACA